MNTGSFDSSSAEETRSLGKRLSAELKAGDVLLLEGELGAGKTCLVQGLCEGLGFSGEVSSPTFTLIQEYRGGRLPAFHIDLYRLEKPGEVEGLGLDEYFEAGGVCLVEWPERLGALPGQAWRFRLSHLSEASRRIRWEPA